MSKKLNILLGLIFIVILGLLLTPIFINYWYGREYLDRALLTLKNPYVEFRIKDFRNNLFSSNAVIAIQPNPAAPDPEIRKLAGVSVDFEAHMQYGPIMWAQTATGSRILFAPAFIRYDLPNNPLMGQLNKFFKTPLFVAQTIISFNGDVESRFSGFTTAAGNPFGKFDGVDIRWLVTPSGKVSMHWKTGLLDISMHNQKYVTVQPISLTAELTPTSYGLYTGTADYNMIGIKIYQANFELRNLIANIVTTNNTNNLISQTSSVKIGGYNSSYSSGQVQLTSSLKDWNGPAIVKLRDDLNQAAANNDEKKAVKILINDFPKIFSKTSSASLGMMLKDTMIGSINFDSNFQKQDSKLNFSTNCKTEQFNIPGVPELQNINSQAKFVVKEINGTALQELLNYFVDSESSMYEAQDKNALQAKMRQDMENMLGRIFLPTSTINFAFNIGTKQYENFELFDFTAKPIIANNMAVGFLYEGTIQLPKKLVDDFSSLTPEEISTNRLIPRLFGSTQNFRKLQEQLPYFIEKGYLQLQGNMYVAKVVADSKQKTLVINGVPFVAQTTQVNTNSISSPPAVNNQPATGGNILDNNNMQPASDMDINKKLNSGNTIDHINKPSMPESSINSTIDAAVKSVERDKMNNQSPQAPAAANMQMPGVGKPPVDTNKSLIKQTPNPVKKVTRAADSLDKLKAAATKGDAAAQYQLGLAYENGKNTQKNLQQAIYWYQKAAAQNNIAATKQIAFIYLHDQTIPNNYKLAEPYLKRAAQKGDIASQTNLGVLYITGDGGVKKDIKHGMQLLRNAGVHQDATAQYNLALIYAEGKIVKKDLVKAYAWASLAANEKPEANVLLQRLKQQMTQQQIEKAKMTAKQLTSATSQTKKI